tara:strand:+ start:163649 stop:164014 length:366 start_codon:yes stop_codon:yes gene_type:complete
MKILEVDLKGIVNKVCKKTGMDKELAGKAEVQYLQYLTLRANYPEMVLVPPVLADELWHEHMLHSKKYVEDCDKLFGSYLHHHQGEPEELLRKGWENTQRLFIQNFGVNLLATGAIAAPCR